MQFTIKDPQQDVLCITVYDRDLFTPNGKTSPFIKYFKTQKIMWLIETDFNNRYL